jgi:hypothetical protein
MGPTSLRDALVALAWCLGILLLIVLMVLVVRAAKRAGRKTSAVAGTMLLMFGLGIAPDVDRERLEDAREEKGRKGGQSGDPPDPEV